jgi:hypothetical protein
MRLSQIFEIIRCGVVGVVTTINYSVVDGRTDTTPFTSNAHAVVSKGKEQMNEHIKRIDMATLDTTVVFCTSSVFAVMTDIKGMELRLTGTFDECS